MAESDTAYYTFMLKSVNQINIEHTRNFRVEDGKPIGLDLLLMSWETLKIQFCQSITDSVLWMLILNRLSDLR